MTSYYSYRGIIYLIRNKIDGKCYVGQTLKRFIDRYSGGKWWKFTTNPYLRRAAVKYGSDAFEVQILEHSKPLEELNRLEAEYAKNYQAYAPTGYNLVECGDNRRQHPDSVLKRSRTVILNDPSGQDVTIVNIRKFCRDNRLDERSLSRVLKGEHASHQGWTLQGVTAKHHRNHHSYTLYEANGTKHEVTGLTAFCQGRGLIYHQMRSMIQGKTVESQGFTLSVEAFSRQRTKHKITLIGHGREVTLTNVKKECGALGLHSRYVYHLISGKLKMYKGWSLKDVTAVPVGS